MATKQASAVPALDLIAQDLARLVSVAIKALSGSIKDRLLSLLGLLPILADFRNIDFTLVKAELIALDEPAHQEIKKAFDNALSIDDPALLQKLIDSADILDQVVDLAMEAAQLVTETQKVVAKIKAILGL